MRLSEAEKGLHHKMREVSELRIQYQCEYRYYLRQQFEGTHSQASTTGIELHRRVSSRADNRQVEKAETRLLPLLIIVITLIAGFLWIFG